jgi:tetraacyldisaccharide 4'-kinase
MMRTSPEERLARLERSGSLASRPALAALSLAAGGYRAGVAARGWLYSAGLIGRRRLPRPVISVGNIEAGGTGKTPLVRLLARLLQEAGLKVAVVSRGYRGQARDRVNVVSDGREILLGPRAAGDEPYLLARSLAGVCVLTGRRRCEPARAAIERLGAEVIVLDDGFQHLRLERNLDLVVLGESLSGRPRLLPRGLLREPLAALGRADAFVLANPEGDGLARMLASRFPGKPRFLARSVPAGFRRAQGGEELAPGRLAGRRLVAFCGIGAPQRFRRTLEALGADLRGFHAFPDHHDYGPKELEALLLLAEAQQAMLVTTEKDAARLEEMPLPGEVWALGVRLEVDDEEALRGLVLKAAAGGVRPQ